MMTVIEGSKGLDKTLSLEAFATKDNVSILVKNQLLKSVLADAADGKELFPGGKYFDEITQHWSSKIWTFLDLLRSASTTHTGQLVTTDELSGSPRDWKLKVENDCYRVMYREGPEGTPFHTLCLDGIVDGDFTSALCVAWESPLYKEWWPQFMVPTFKITESKYLRRIRVGEDLSLLRFKVPWPLAQREVLMSAFELEYLQEDLIIVLLESVPEAEKINEKLHGFSAENLPASSNVRMDVAGGFVMQRKSKDQFFFRTIVNVDMKLDFVPPWLINFMSRQLAGQGLKLYQKAVLAVSNGTGHGKAFQKLLKTEHLYERVRSSLGTKAMENGDPFTSLPIERLPTLKETVKAKTLQGSIRRMGSSENNRVVPYPVRGDQIEETVLEVGTAVVDPVHPPVESRSTAPETQPVAVKSDVACCSKQAPLKKQLSSNEHEAREYDDPEIEWALNTLDKMILFTNAYAAEPSSDTGTVHSDGKDAKSDNVVRDLQEAPVNNNGRPPLPPGTNQSCSIVVKMASKVTPKLDNRESSRSPGLQASADSESSGTSGFWSTSEIEIVSSQDDTDTDVGASGRITSKGVKEPELPAKRRRSRWRWTCFSPSYSRKHERGRGNLYADDNTFGLQDPGRTSAGHWKSVMGDSNRFFNRGYATDGDDVTNARERFDSRGYPTDRFVTLGELLMDDGH